MSGFESLRARPSRLFQERAHTPSDALGSRPTFALLGGAQTLARLASYSAELASRPAAMPRWLESLTIRGFKSFAVEQTLAFERGLCVISGPNGAGKSNVIDALLFALGEEPAKLRVARLGELRSSSTEHAAGALTCAVTAVVRVLADGSYGRHTLSAELKADRRECRLDGAVITAKALREWLGRAGLVAEGALYCIRQAAVQDAVQSATLYPLIVQASGCSSYLSARADAAERLRANESHLAKITADIATLKAVCDKAETEHALLMERMQAARESAQTELLAGLAQDELCAAELRQRTVQMREAEGKVDCAQRALAACDSERSELGAQMAALNASEANALQRAEGVREQLERLLPQVEGEETALVDARVEMASTAARLARLKGSMAEASDAADGTLLKVKALHASRALVASTEGALAKQWNSIAERLGAPAEQQASADLLQRELERLQRLQRELSLKRERAGAQLASSRASADKARSALLDARQAVVTLEASLADASAAGAAVDHGTGSDDEQRDAALEAAEGRRSRAGLQLGRLKRELQQLADDIQERTSVPPLVEQVMGAAKRPVCTLASLVRLRTDAEQWSGALDALLAPALRCLVVETTADASTLVRGVQSVSSESFRIWPLDRIQETDVLALARAQESVISRLGADPGTAAACPLALLECATAVHEQAIAFAVGTKLLVQDGESAHRVLAAASSLGLLWCVDECIAADGTRHRRGTVRGGFDRAGAHQLVALLARQGAASREADTLGRELASHERFAARLRAEASAHASRAALAESLASARACLVAAAECARVHEERVERATSGSDGHALVLELLDAAQLAWPAAGLQQARALDAAQARNAVARCGELLRAQCRTRYAAIDDQLALAENLDIKAHASAESCAQLCERLEWTVGSCAKRAEAAALRLAALDATELAASAAELEAACRDAADASRRAAKARADVRASASAKAQRADELARWTAELESLRDKVAGLEAGQAHAARETKWAHLAGEDGGGSSAAFASVLERCAALLRAQPDAPTDGHADGARSALVDAWRALSSEAHSLRAAALCALRRLEASTASLDEAQVLASADVQVQRRDELAGFEAKSRTITESIQVLIDGIAETDGRSRAAIDTSLETISRAFNDMFSELVPSKQATILTVDGDSPTGGDAARQLCVAVRARSASSGEAAAGAWSRDLRELSGGQRTLLSVALLVSCSLHKAGDLLIIDEVDAALDDKNVELIAHLLHRVASKTQVLAISHRSEFQKLASRRIAISAGSRIVASTAPRV